MPVTCYKPFASPQAIGFDLDDTLYDNRLVLQRAEQALQQHLSKVNPRFSALSLADWLGFKQQALHANGRLVHDISQIRIAVLTLAFQSFGYDSQQTTELVAQAFRVFIKARNTITIAPDTRALLAKLATKYRLFVISNGNADIQQIGLASYFEFAIHPNVDCPMKPDQTLFLQAEQQLGLSQQQVCYIGDHPVSDVVGANHAGWQSIWLNAKQQKLNHRKKPLQLPTVEINQLNELSFLT